MRGLGADLHLLGLSKIPTVPPSERDGTFNRRESDRLSSSRSATAVFKGEIRRVVLVESDQYYREVLTFELLCQGFVVHAFPDGASLIGLIASVIDAPTLPCSIGTC
jgi:hypothetical protein